MNIGKPASPLYGFIVGATIGKGRITGIDASRAERSPGGHPLQLAGAQTIATAPD
jgi:hypothetical protein